MSKESSRGGRWKKHMPFYYTVRDEDGTANVLEDDQPKTTQPTRSLITDKVPPRVKSGFINRILYRLNPTNAVTYTLRIWSAAIDGTSTPYTQNQTLLYESPAAQADDTTYDRAELNIPFYLGTPGVFYYSIDWSGTPGNTPGHINVTGEVVEA